MEHGEKAQKLFDEALRYFEFIDRKGFATEFELEQFRIICLEFLEQFVHWQATASVHANAYKAYTRSTPLDNILTIPENKLVEWLDHYLDRNIKSKHI